MRLVSHPCSPGTHDSRAYLWFSTTGAAALCPSPFLAEGSGLAGQHTGGATSAGRSMPSRAVSVTDGWELVGK